MRTRIPVAMALVAAMIGGGCGRDVVAPKPKIAAPAPDARVIQSGATIVGTSSGNVYNVVLSDAGHVVWTANDGVSTHNAFLWYAGQTTQLTPTGSGYTYATGVNSAGQVVGSYQANGGYEHAFVWKNGVLTDLAGGPTVDRLSAANAINEAGDIVGYMFYPTAGAIHATLWRNGVATDLGTLGGRESNATGINNTGQVIGYSRLTDGGPLVGFIWENGVMTALPLSTNSDIRPVDINDNGEIVLTFGTSGRYPYLWRAGELLQVAPAEFAIAPHALDNEGRVVGEVSYPVVAEGGEVTYLDSRGNPGTAFAINNLNQVAGATQDQASGYSEILVWTIAPDPTEFDTDLDGIRNDLDNCPAVANPDQTDLDADGAGNACDPDADGDGVLDTSDNCPTAANATQHDFDGDNIGDACDAAVAGGVNPGGPYAGQEGETIAFRSGTSEFADPRYVFEWDFDDASPTVQGARATHVYADDNRGPFGTPITPRLNLYYDDVLVATAPVPLTLSNAPPAVTVTGATTASVSERVVFSATASDPGVQDGPWNFRVRWSDGLASSLLASKDPRMTGFSRDFTSDGTYTVTVEATDKDGGIGSGTLTITVGSPPGTTQPGTNVPVAPVDPSTGTSPVTLQFSNVTSGGTTTVTSSSQGAPLPNGFRVGNPPTFYDVATTATFSGAVTLCFTYPEIYPHEANLKLMHQEPSGVWVDVTTSLDVNTNTICGSVTSLSPFTVAEQNQRPVAMAGGPYSGSEGSAVRFSATGSHDPDGATLSYLWSFGDGTTSISEQPSHTYVDEGNYNVTLTVTDADHASNSSTTTAFIRNVAPTVSAGAGIEMLSGGTFTLGGSFSDPGRNDSPWTYTVSWGDGRTLNDQTSVQGAISANARYLQAGSYVARLRVVDVDGDAGEAATTVIVRRIPVSIDIKPGSSDNSIKLADASDAQIPVAVLSTGSFDATAIDANSVSLAGVNVSVKKNGSIFASTEDVNGDGLKDLVLHFARTDLVTNGDLTATTTALALIGNLTDGRQVAGSDAVRPIQ